MIRLITWLLLALLPAIAHAGGYQVQENTSWKNQFAGAVHWSTLGVVADSTTDNTAALNALPVNTPIIGDCPAGGTIYAAGTWFWRSGLTVWQQPACKIVSGVTTVGQFAIDDPNFVNNTGNANIQYYGLWIHMQTPTSQVRVIRYWADHLKLKHFLIDGSGGFAFLRGSDQEVAYGHVVNTIAVAGNPGIRHIGNSPKVATSPGMHANVYAHHIYAQTGDASFQACQPLTTALWTNVSTDDLLYENVSGVSGGSSFLLVNLPNTTGFNNFTCQNVTYRNFNGGGWWGGLICSGAESGLTSNILLENGTLDQSGSTASNTGSLNIGNWTAGTNICNSLNPAQNIALRQVTFNNTYRQSVIATNTQNLTIDKSTVNGGRSCIFNAVEIDGGSGFSLTNSTLHGCTNVTVNLGATAAQTVSPVVENNTITGCSNNLNCVSLGNVTGATVSANTISGGNANSKGIVLKANPQGTINSIVQNNDVSAMPATTKIVCAPSQGNTVTGNNGALDCPP
jgi:hypothetical protein